MATVEISPNNFFEPATLSFTKDKSGRGSKASMSIILPLDESLPALPALVSVVCKRIVNNVLTDYKKFGGELNAQGVGVDLDDGKRKYDLQVDDFFSFTGRKQIDSYSAVGSLASIVGDLVQQGGAFIPGNALNLLSTQVIATAGGGSVDPERPNISFGWDDGPKYLFEALDMLAAQEGYEWEVIDNGWLAISELTAGTIATLRFRKKGIQTVEAPKSEFRIPLETDACPDIYWEGDPQLRITGPRATQIIVLGKNGNPDLSTPTTANETVKYNIPVSATRLIYEYPQTVTEISSAVLTP